MSADSETKKKRKLSERINIPYILKKIGVLIALLIFSFILVVRKAVHFPGYVFFLEYFKFACCVIGYGIFTDIYTTPIKASVFHYDRWPFLPWKWEKGGEIYQQKLHVKDWKGSLFDASIAFPFMLPKQIRTTDPAYLLALVQETCKAEWTHWTILIVGTTVMAVIVDPFWNVFYCIVYAISNISDIVTQRYNRPRLVRMYERALRHQQKTMASAEA